MGGEIGQQLLAQPKALLIGGGMLLGFALIPGFPKPQFIVLGLTVGGIGFGLYRSAMAPKGKSTFASPVISAKKKKTAPTDKGEEFSLTVPLLIDIAASVEDYLEPEVFNEELVRVRKALYYDLGVPLPAIHLRFNEGLTDGAYHILLQEIPMSQGRILKDHLLVKEREDELDILGIEYLKDEKFLPNLPTLWAHVSLKDQLLRAGLPFMEGAQILTYHLSFILKKHADEFIGLQETKFLMEKMEGQYPELVKELLRILPLQKVGEILQRLVQEDISIRNLRSIFQSLIEWGQKEKDTVLLTEYIRSGLKRHISFKYCGGRNVLAVYLFDPGLEETIRKAIRQTSGGSYLALDPNTAKKIVDRIKREVGDISRQVQKPVLLTSMDIRRYVRKLIELDLYDLPVLSYQELTPEITIQPLSRISL